MEYILYSLYRYCDKMSIKILALLWLISGVGCDILIQRGLVMKIGNVEFEHITFLAPMAGIADRAFRELCVEHGAGYTVSEMVS